MNAAAKILQSRQAPMPEKPKIGRDGKWQLNLYDPNLTPRRTDGAEAGGHTLLFWEKCSERLAHASLLERNRAELSPSGYGIHWPLIDENLAVGPLLRATA